MSDTLLDLLPDAPAHTEPAATPEENFAQWRDRNSAAVEHITRLAISAARRGARRVSMKSLFEAARAAGAFGDTTTQPYRLDNSRTAQMARYLMERHPSLTGLFETRRRRAS